MWNQLKKIKLTLLKYNGSVYSLRDITPVKCSNAK